MYREVNSKIVGGLLENKKKNDVIIIVYHWNSCGHCRSFMPMFHDLLNRERNLMDMSNIFSVEYDNFDFLPNDLRNVNAFPMIISYENGKKKEEFKEQRTEDNLKKFIKENSSKSSSTSSLSSSSSSSKTKKQLKKYSSSKK
jgi:thiol-disulfide isomerase/thioredoxin